MNITNVNYTTAVESLRKPHKQECVCACVYVPAPVNMVYEDTNLCNDMCMTKELQGEGGLQGHFLCCPHTSKGFKNCCVFFDNDYL